MSKSNIFNCPNLAAFWSNFISLVVYFYTLYSSWLRYKSWRSNFIKPRYGFLWNYSFLIIYFYHILLSCILFIIMLYSMIFKTGHLANDFINLKRENIILDYEINSRNLSKIFKRFKSRIKYHLKPFASYIHLLGSYCLLIPLFLLISENKQHSILQNDSSLSTQIMPQFSPEILNIILAMSNLIVRSPHIFHYTCKSLSIILSIQLFFTSTTILTSILWNFYLALQIPSSDDIIHLFCLQLILHLIVFTTILLIHESSRATYLSNVLCEDDEYRFKWEKYPPLILNIIMICLFVTLTTIQHFTVPYEYISWIEITTVLLFCLIWIICSILLCFKTKWNFKLRPSSILTQDSVSGKQTNFLQIKNSTFIPTESTIYTCFQGHTSLGPPTMTSQSSSTSNSRDPDSVILDPIIFTDGNYDEINKHSQARLNHISEEDNCNYTVSGAAFDCNNENNMQPHLQLGEYFKSPNVSMRSSNVHSSDSGIGGPIRDRVGVQASNFNLPNSDYSRDVMTRSDTMFSDV